MNTICKDKRASRTFRTKILETMHPKKIYIFAKKIPAEKSIKNYRFDYMASRPTKIGSKSIKPTKKSTRI